MNTNIDTRGGVPHTSDNPPPVVHQKGTTGVELAIQVGARLADLAAGKGLLPTTKADGTEDLEAVAKNEAIQKAQVAGLNAQIDELQTEIQQAFTVIANPSLHSADDVKAAKGLIVALTEIANPNGALDAAGVARLDGTTAPPPSTHEYNAHLSGIVSVALLSAMMEFMKSQEVGQKIASNMWLETKAATEDCNDAIVQNIKDKARLEAIECIVKAACSAGSMVMSVGAGMGSMRAKTTTDAQAISSFGRAGEQLFTGFLQNAALAPLTIAKGDTDAQKQILDMIKGFLETLMQKETEMGNDYSKNFDSFNDALKQWIDALSRIGNKMSAHG